MGWRSRFLLILFLAAISSIWPVIAQDSDTIIRKDDDHQTFTILSQVEDPRERQAFTDLYEAKEPKLRHRLAESFLRTYPQSWLLSEAYHIAATSSIDLGDYQSALKEGLFSLRLMPENPLLLVPLANVEVQQKLFDQAEGSARNALEYLDRFVRPGNLSEAQWATLRPQLKASAYFVLGRVYAARGLGDNSPSRSGFLKQASVELDSAAAWNPDDPEIFFLRALVELSRGNAAKASRDLAFVARGSNSLSSKALQHLRDLYKEGSSKQELSFDQFLAGVPKPEINRVLREEIADQKPSAAIREGYAGSTACRSCHVREYDTWRQTGMAKMLREYQAENIIGDFSTGRVFKDELGNTIVRMGSDNRPYFDIKSANGTWERFHVDYTIGSKWQQGYATKQADGGLQVIPIQYNALHKTWLNYWAIIDPPDSKRAVISDFPKLTRATNYQENCAICHTSQLRGVSASDDSLERAVFREPGIDCEMCHGPSAWHIKEMWAGRVTKMDATEPPFDFRKVNNREGVRVCAQCHRQSAIREMGAQNEMNYSTEDASFVPQTWTRPFDAFSRRAFYKDGRFRETTFIVEAFTRSACYRKGTLQCANCHAPHLPNFSQNPTSLKFKDNPDEMCLPCHDQFRGRLAVHTHHAVQSEGSRCVSCHMPRIVNALLFQARSHEIEIPRADLTKRFGQEESPNACLLCHSEKNAQWAERELERW